MGPVFSGEGRQMAIEIGFKLAPEPTARPTAKPGCGDKYEETKDLDIAKIAKLVREDIKAAIAAKTLPAGKYPVRISRYAGGQSLSVTLSDLPFNPLNPERVRNPHSNQDVFYSGEAVELIHAVEGLAKAYGYDHSDLQSDYFNVRFYTHVEFGSDWEATQREALKARIAAGEAIPPVRLSCRFTFCKKSEATPGDIYCPEHDVSATVIPLPLPVKTTVDPQVAFLTSLLGEEV